MYTLQPLKHDLPGDQKVNNSYKGLLAVILISFSCSHIAQAHQEQSGQAADSGQMVVLKLVSGDRLTGKLVSSDDGSYTLVHSILGKITIPSKDVESVLQLAKSPDDAGDEKKSAESASDENDGSKSSESDKSGESGKTAPSSAATEPEKPKSPWTSSFSLSFTGSWSNSNSMTLRLGFKTQRKTESTLLSINTSYYYNQSSGETKNNDFLFDIINQWTIGKSKWFVFAQGRYQYNEFEAWEHRVEGYGGVGYYFINNDKALLEARAGMGASKELSGKQQLQPNALAGLSGNWNFDKIQSINGSITFLSDVADLSQYRVLANGEYVLKLPSLMDGLAFNAGFNNEYQSTVTGSSTHNDLKIYAGIQLQF